MKPLFSKARTARRWLTPGSFGTPSTPLLPLPESWSVLKLLRPLQGTPEWRIGCSRVPLARSCPATSNPEGPDTKRCSLPLIFSVRLCISWRHHSDSAFAVTPVQLTIALQPRRFTVAPTAVGCERLLACVSIHCESWFSRHLAKSRVPCRNAITTTRSASIR